MDSKRAAEVLRNMFYPSPYGEEARDTAIQALEAWAWVERHVDDIDTRGSWRTGDGWAKVYYNDGQVAEAATVYAAVLDAMSKEGKE